MAERRQRAAAPAHPVRGFLGAAAFLAALWIAGVAALAAEPVPSRALDLSAEQPAPGTVAEPGGYRTDAYRAPTPPTLTGAVTINTEAARKLHAAGNAVFVDVLPRVPRPKGLPATALWRPKPRDDIPGSIWLVDTGYGALAPVMEGYFLDGLARATGGNRTRPIVFYCLRDCWMSWNAAKRAMASGYTAVYWYPEGTDGWAGAGLPLERREPEPRPDE